MAGKAKTLTGKDLGAWKVRRNGENEITLTIPPGMKIVGNDLKIEDVMGAISNYIIVKKGRVLSCCSGNVAIA